MFDLTAAIINYAISLILLIFGHWSLYKAFTIEDRHIIPMGLFTSGMYITSVIFYCMALKASTSDLHIIISISIYGLVIIGGITINVFLDIRRKTS